MNDDIMYPVDVEEFFEKHDYGKLELQMLCLKMTDYIDFCPLDQKQKEWECHYHPNCEFCKIEYCMDLVFHEIGAWVMEERLKIRAEESKRKKPEQKNNVIRIDKG